MFTVTIQSTFTATHGLKLPNGQTEPDHPHDWIVKAAVSAKTLDDSGFAVDFELLKSLLDQAIAPLQNKKLENTQTFAQTNPSAENVAKYIYDTIAPQIQAPATLQYIKVMEAKNCWAKYENRK